MNLHEYRNVRRVLRTMAVQWNCPVWMVKRVIRRSINKTWKQAMSNPEETALLIQYFPKGKPSPNQYILRLGQAYETGEDVPFLLTK